MPALTHWRFALRFVICVALCVAATPAMAQRRGGGDAGRGVSKSRITPHGFAGGTKLWYQNDLPGGEREYIVVDAERGIRERVADREVLDKLLAQEGGEISGNVPAPSNAARTTTTASRRTGDETELTFINRTSGEIELFWRDTAGQRQSYGKLAVGERKAQHTFSGHVWEVTSAGGNSLGLYEAEDAPKTIEIDGRPPRAPAANAPSQPGRSRPSGSARNRSPDGKWLASIKDHNIILRATDHAGAKSTPNTPNFQEIK